MKISYNGIFGFLEREPEERVVFDLVRRKFSWLNPDRYKIDAFRKGWWDGYVHQIDKNGRFLRGLASLIAAELSQMGCSVSYEPFEAPWAAVGSQYLPLVDSLVLDGITLADHQRYMTRELLRHGGGTVEGVTGSGKTESIALLVKILLEFTSPVFFLVHRIGLMRGACERVKKRCPELAPYCGLLGDGERPSFTNKIIFSTVQSLNAIHGFTSASISRDKDLEKIWAKAGAIIIDEAHRVTGDSYLRILRRVEEAPIFQFTGTPEVDDVVKDWTIIGIGGPIVARVTRSEMEKIGFIAEAVACIREFKQQLDGQRRKVIKWSPEKQDKAYVIQAYSVDEVTGALQETTVTVDPKKGIGAQDETFLYPAYARDMLILQEERNADIGNFCEASLAADRPVLVLCEKIAQLYYLRGILSKKLRTKIGVLHGEHSSKQRKEVSEEFETGKLSVLLASTIFDEGEDLQNIGSVVLAAGGASLVRVIQRIGRGVRAKDSTRGNYCPIWCSVDFLTKYSREHTEQRVNYLDRAQITIEECTEDWPAFFRYLKTEYGHNITRI